MKNWKSRVFRSLVLTPLIFSMGVTGKGCGGEDTVESEESLYEEMIQDCLENET